MHEALVGILLLLYLTGCSPGKTPVTDPESPHFGSAIQKHTVQRLPNGAEVRIVSVAKGFFTEDKTALVLTYITDHPLERREAIEREADAIWPVFRVNVDNEGIALAMIMAEEPREPSFGATYGHVGFIWRKSPSGEWAKSDE